jgi:coatomer subunit beta'
MYLLGYLPAHNRVYLCDKEMQIYSYALSLFVVEYQTAILRGDYDAANELLPNIPNDQRNRIARFLETQGARDPRLCMSC